MRAEVHEYVDSENTPRTPAESARKRGSVFGAFMYDIESSGLPLTEDKTDQLMAVVYDIALKPPGLRISSEKYNENFRAGSQAAIEYLRDTLNPQEVENRNKFYERISVFDPHQQLRIRIAYDLAKYSHRGIAREDGSRYFEHVRNTALILFDEARIKDNPDLLIAALLHDAVEDATIFGSQKDTTTQEWMEEAGLRLSHIFGPNVAEMVSAVTKPKIDGEAVLDKADVKRIYLENLRKASPEAILIKMADRLHNLRTLYVRSREDQRKVAKETLEDYLPIFEAKSVDYAEFSKDLLAEIRDLATQYLSDDEEIIIQGKPVQRWDTRELTAFL